MLFQRSFHFYAAHRNQFLPDKCAGLHGHRYQVDYRTTVKRAAQHHYHATTMFHEFDALEDKWRKYFDHALLLDSDDPLLPKMQEAIKTDIMSQYWNLRMLPMPSSIENLAFMLFRMLKTDLLNAFRSELDSITVRETDSTALIYDTTDYKADLIRFPTPRRTASDAEPASPTDS